MLGEFDLIKRYFTPMHYSQDVLLGVGDDAAVLAVPAESRLVAAVDTVVEGVHFPSGTSAADIAYRALAVNLSDMAAMGARPRWFTLSLSLPQVDEKWISEFASALRSLAARFEVQLVGGDTVKGSLSISIQILGLVDRVRWLTRNGAQPGDLIFISGIPGEAAGGLQLVLNPQIKTDYTHKQQLLERFHRPTPRVELGLELVNAATSAMDVSDGLLTDLRKLCKASQVGAQIELDLLPVSTPLVSVFGKSKAEHYALQGGDDYELLFTLPANKQQLLEVASKKVGVVCTQIGCITNTGEVQCYRDQQPVVIPDLGFDHFAR